MEITTTTKMKPTTYTVTHSTGEINTITSKRIYTHAVVVSRTPSWYAYEIKRLNNELAMNEKAVAGGNTFCASYIAKNKADIADATEALATNRQHIFVGGWSQSAANAAKLAKQVSKYHHTCKIEVVAL